MCGNSPEFKKRGKKWLKWLVNLKEKTEWFDLNIGDHSGGLMLNAQLDDVFKMMISESDKSKRDKKEGKIHSIVAESRPFSSK